MTGPFLRSSCHAASPVLSPLSWSYFFVVPRNNCVLVLSWPCWVRLRLPLAPRLVPHCHRQVFVRCTLVCLLSTTRPWGNFCRGLGATCAAVVAADTNTDSPSRCGPVVSCGRSETQCRSPTGCVPAKRARSLPVEPGAIPPPVQPLPAGNNNDDDDNDDLVDPRRRAQRARRSSAASWFHS